MLLQAMHESLSRVQSASAAYSTAFHTAGTAGAMLESQPTASPTSSHSLPGVESNMQQQLTATAQRCVCVILFALLAYNNHVKAVEICQNATMLMLTWRYIWLICALIHGPGQQSESP